MSANVKVTVVLHFTDEYLGNILVTAFDGQYGGCWFWAEPKGPNWLVTAPDSDDCPFHWKSCTVREKEASNGTKRKWAVVDHEMVARGIQRVLESKGREHLKQRLLSGDDDIDSYGADTIIQFAIFGEEVYG